MYISKHISDEHTIKLLDLFVDLNYIYLVFEYCNRADLNKCL